MNQTTEERGHFHVDQMFGCGSATLIKYDNKYFLLTAKHVINNNITKPYQNESPFWVALNSKSTWNSLDDFLMPRKAWNIHEVINRNDQCFDSVNIEDICLIELFSPMPNLEPDFFLDFGKYKGIDKSQFFNGQLLIANRYPFKRNFFEFESIGDFTHSTQVQRHSIPGSCIVSDNEIKVYFSTDTDVTHEDVNGMSGGVICNVEQKANQVKYAGMIVSAGNNKCGFIPSYLVYEAVTQYQSCSHEIIDPADSINL